MRRTAEERQELSDRAHAIYEKQLKSKVETEENIGKIISIDTLTGDYEINTDHLTAVRLLRQRHPNAKTFGIRIGYKAVYAIGGILERTTL